MKKLNLFLKITAAIIILCCFTTHSFSQAGNALDFDGTNDYANGSGINTALTNITLEAWVYHHTLPASIERYVTVGSEVAVIRHDGWTQQGQLHFFIKTAGVLRHIRVNNALQTGKWYHVAGTWDGTDMKLYLNGEEVGTNTPGGVLDAPDGSVLISRDTETMDGYIDEVRIWNDSRTPEEIRTNMYKTLTGTETGLENYWMFNESSGSTAYDSAGSVNLTLNNMYDDDWVVSGAFTGPRNTLDFDGTNEYVSVPDNDNLDLTTTYTLEAWIKPASFGNIKGIISKYHTPGSNGYLLRLHNISPYSGLCFDQLYTSTGILESNHWYHIAAINDNGTRKLYLNGAEQALSGTPLSVQANSDPLCIGVDYLTSGRYFDGKIDEVRIWNDVRTPTEIREYMCQALAGNESGLVAYYRFDQEQGTTLYDLTSNGNDGTLTNMADNDWVSSNAFNTWIGCAGTDWAESFNWSRGTYPNSNIENAGIPNYTGGNQPVLDGNFTCNNLIIGTGADFIINSGRILTVNGNAFINGTQSGIGKIELTGALASHTIAGTFNNIEIDESDGADMDGNAIINGTLTLTYGQFYVGSNTLTIKNAIDGTPANLVAGITSSITIAGSVSGVNIPAHVSVLNNMGLANSNGTILQSDLLIDGTMTLTNGALTTNGYALSYGPDGTLKYNGTSLQTTTSNEFPSTNNPHNLIINNAAGVNLAFNRTIDSTLILTNGDLDLNGDTLTLGVNATLSESVGNTVIGDSGIIITTRTFNAGDLTAGINIAGMGADIMTDSALGETTIIRGHAVQTLDTTEGILRYFDISPANNSGLDARLIFHYDNTELNGITAESQLELYRSTDTGNTWSDEGGVNYNNSITLEGINAFSRWTAFKTGFTEIDAGLTGVYIGSVAWGDYDNDGDLDILLTGYSDNGKTCRVYRNDGSGTFTDINAGLTGVYQSSVAWGDYDNDGDLDILLTGSDENNDEISRVYRNDGSGTFTDINGGLAGVYRGSVAWGDYDNDGDLDILLTGWDNGRTSRVYRNNGSGTFTDINAGLTRVCHSSVAWGDYDNDGDLDILLTGENYYHIGISRVYCNDGSGIFTDINAGLTGGRYSSVAWGDYDNDGDLDILLTGEGDNGRTSCVYRNDGSGSFTDINAGLTGVWRSSVAWGDYDNDGDLDILLTGYSYNGRISRVYRNDGSGTFTDINAGLTSVSSSSVAWGDFDNDGDLDILLTGEGDNDKISYIYRNDILVANTTPGTPGNLSASVSGRNVTLDWAKATDNETAQDALTYNICIGTLSGGVQTVSPMADVSNGYRKVAALGNTNHNNSWDIKNLAGGTYYWSVQAIDNAFAGSAFATESSFCLIGITTADITDITDTTASCGGNAFSDCNYAITAKGIVWDTLENPTVETNIGITNDGSGLGSFTSSLTGLTSGQTYYIRAYAINSEDTSYGENKSFFTTMSKGGNMLDFDGTDDYVEVLHSIIGNPAGSFTISAWAKLAISITGSGNVDIISKHTNENKGYYIEYDLDMNKISAGLGNGNDLNKIEGQNWKFEQWHFVTLTYDAVTDEIKFYDNGILQGNITEPFPSFCYTNFRIGGSENYGNFIFGTIDEVRYWSVARSQAEIRENMHRTLNGVEANLVAYYCFDHISGTALSDRTSNDNDGTLHNMDNQDWVTSTAPIPYFTVINGNWESNSTWATGQNPPVHPWSRAMIKHNITLNSNIELMEMIVDTTAIMTISTGDTLIVGGE